MNARNARRFTALTAAALILPMTGCLVSGSSKSSYEGEYFGSRTVAQIKAGKTTKEWVLATLGEPTHRSTLSDGSELWRWSYEKKESSSGYVFLFAGGSSHSETRKTAFVQFDTDGIVTKAWQD